MSPRSLLLSVFLVSACASATPEPAPEQAAPEAAPEVVEAPPAMDPVALGRAQATMKMLGVTLKGELMKNMKAGGPTAAMGVCSQDASSLTAALAASSGVKVGRSSLRLRNPDNAAPDWVADWLKQQGERPAKGVEGYAMVAQLDDGSAAVRALAPLAIEAPCLICHGPEEGRSAELTAALAASYPQDQATGYAFGDLRGAIWAEAPVVDTGMTLELDGAARWQLDESTRSTIGEIRAGVSGEAPADLAEAHALAESLSDSVSRMIQGCSMEGASHDQLHHFLEAFFPALEELKTSATLADASRARWLLQAQVAQFDVYFE